MCYAVIVAGCNGFTALVTIKNTGNAPIKGWTVCWNYVGNQTVIGAFDGAPVQSGKAVRVANAGCNQTIVAGGTACFSLQACYSGANINPTTFTLL